MTISCSFAISDDFSQHLAVLMTSIAVNNPTHDFVFHVLHRSISPENEARLASIHDRYPRCRCVFHRIDPAFFAGFRSSSPHITQEAWYRILLASLLGGEDRTIWLDADILVYGDLGPLWTLDLGDAAAAMVDDGMPDARHREYERTYGYPPSATYCCSGVILFDLKRIRDEGLEQRFIALEARFRQQLKFADQDVLNLALAGRIAVLSSRWGYSGAVPLGPGEKVVIRHFASFGQKPWNLKLNKLTWIPYLHYLRRSPYRDRAGAFVRAHVKAWFYYRYVKNGVESVDILGIRVFKRRKAACPKPT